QRESGSRPREPTPATQEPTPQRAPEDPPCQQQRRRETPPRRHPTAPAAHAAPAQWTPHPQHHSQPQMYRTPVRNTPHDRGTVTGVVIPEAGPTGDADRTTFVPQGKNHLTDPGQRPRHRHRQTTSPATRSEEHTSELQSREKLV